jgi:hypothetical protein
MTTAAAPTDSIISQPDLYASRIAAAHNVGRARRKENSAAATAFRPSSIPARMVTMAREVPGHIARHCAKPMISAIRSETSSIVLRPMRLGRRARSHEYTIITTPPTANAIATGRGPNRCALIGL